MIEKKNSEAIDNEGWLHSGDKVGLSSHLPSLVPIRPVTKSSPRFGFVYSSFGSGSL